MGWGRASPMFLLEGAKPNSTGLLYRHKITHSAVLVAGTRQLEARTPAIRIIARGNRMAVLWVVFNRIIKKMEVGSEQRCAPHRHTALSQPPITPTPVSTQPYIMAAAFSII